MYRVLLSIFVLILILAGMAQAAVDPAPDVIGVYFDAGATMVSFVVPPFATPIPVYVVLTNPIATQITGFGFGYHLEVQDGLPGSLVRVAEHLPPGVISLGDSSDLFAGDYIIQGIPSPILAEQNTVLMSWEFMLVSSAWVEFDLGPASDHPMGTNQPVYYDGTEMYEMGFAQTCFGTGSVLGLSCPLDTAPQSFSSVKALYR